jgi:hypothetical protein
MINKWNRVKMSSHGLDWQNEIDFLLQSIDSYVKYCTKELLADKDLNFYVREFIKSFIDEMIDDNICDQINRIKL